MKYFMKTQNRMVAYELKKLMWALGFKVRIRFSGPREKHGDCLKANATAFKLYKV
jgi:hypothetical protein